MDPRYFFFRPETSGLQKKFWDDKQIIIKSEEVMYLLNKNLCNESTRKKLRNCPDRK